MVFDILIQKFYFSHWKKRKVNKKSNTKQFNKFLFCIQNQAASHISLLQTFHFKIAATITQTTKTTMINTRERENDRDKQKTLTR